MGKEKKLGVERLTWWKYRRGGPEATDAWDQVFRWRCHAGLGVEMNLLLGRCSRNGWERRPSSCLRPRPSMSRKDWSAPNPLLVVHASSPRWMGTHLRHVILVTMHSNASVGGEEVGVLHRRQLYQRIINNQEKQTFCLVWSGWYGTRFTQPRCM